MKAVIMAGGQGTRIRSVAADIPKSMIPVLGKPILRYQIENLKKNGITDIILVTGYLRESITEYFGSGSSLGVSISYFNEDHPMGTAGALYYLKDALDEDFILLMGDLMLSVDFGRFMDAHRSSGAMVTLFAHPNSHPYDSDIIEITGVGSPDDYTEDKCGINIPVSALSSSGAAAKRVSKIIGKREIRPSYCRNLVNAGIYAVSPGTLACVPEPLGHKIDLDKDIIRPLTASGAVYAYRSSEYVRDMGTPERYDEVTDAVRKALMDHRNLANPQKCVFLDRDGTINIYKGLIDSPGDIELIPGAAEAIRRFNASEYLTVLITNQPVLARGDLDFAGYDEIEKCLETLLGREGAYLDMDYFCPHHPDTGFDGEIKKLKFRCRCRKPASGMFDQAAVDLNIDLAGSYMIGDMTADIRGGNLAGIKTIALRTGLALSDCKYEVSPDYEADDLLKAADIILGRA